MEVNMIKNSLDKKGIDAEIIPHRSSTDLRDKLKGIINKPKIALNFGENVFDLEGTYYADFLPFGTYLTLQKLAPNTEFTSAAPIIYGLRSVKSSEELKNLRDSCKATIEILETVPDLVKVGMTERELMAKLHYEYSKLGKPSFPAIVANREHSADPHHNSTIGKIKPGALLIDTGMQFNGMCSDITWTFWIGSNIPEEFFKAYDALYKSKIEANKFYIEGTPNYLPAQKCRESLAEIGYDHKKLFFHGLGHSLGYVAHDVGTRINLDAPEKITLKENMVYTNEPGLYWQEKWGIRLEDDVIIGKEKCEKLTYNHKEPILIN
jgi:Xaa-Pro dipeptidase